MSINISNSKKRFIWITFFIILTFLIPVLYYILVNQIGFDYEPGLPPIVSVDYGTSPEKVILNESFNSEKEMFNDIKIKVLEIDQNNQRCLIKYEGPIDSNTFWRKKLDSLISLDVNDKRLLGIEDTTDSNFINPQWFKSGEAIFPSIYGKFGVTIDSILDHEIYIVRRWGETLSGKEAEKYLEKEKRQ